MNKKFLTLFLLFFAPQHLFAAMQHGADHPKIFHAFTLDSDIGEGNSGLSGAINLNGWVGTDYDRLLLKNETKAFKKYDTKTEFQALYGKNISQFWDAQIGVRHDLSTDFSSQSLDYVTLGLEGLAPYFFETEAQVFLSNQGNYSAHLKQEIDIFITQKLITQPYFEADFFAQDVQNIKVASGLSEVEVGALTRYEITHRFAPYIALRYNRKTFGTEEIAKRNHDRISDFIASIGLRLRF
ncbi:MAG: copper resistance protein B [Proteobacteria bacterium]|nr:copper resistance protein B [Pseudomonadota bacterium]